MKTAAIIALFVGNEHIMSVLRRPIARGGYLYASNGHIAVRVKDDDTVDCTNTHDDNPAAVTVVAGIERMLAEDYFTGGFPLANALQTTQCEAELASCPECAGTGITPAGQYDPAGSVCIACDGDGTDWRDVRRQIGHSWYSPRYLKRLAALPGATLCEARRLGDAARIEFDGGLALVMPMRPPRGDAR